MRDDISFMLLFCKAFNDTHKNDKGKLNKTSSEWLGNHFGKLLLTLIKADQIQREIELVLSRLGIKHDTPFFKTYGREELIISIKYYLISWSTLKELTLHSISTALELGLAERDISYGVLSRNDHFKKTNLPKIFKKHESVISLGQTSNKRNKIVHEGMLFDEDIEELNSKHAELNSKRIPSFSFEIQMNDEDYNEQVKKINIEWAELCKIKKLEYDNHYKDTVSMLKDITNELAIILSNKINDKIL